MWRSSEDSGGAKIGARAKRERRGSEGTLAGKPYDSEKPVRP